MKKALVLGATGLVGQEVVRLLLQDESYDQVTLLVRRRLPLQHPKVEQQIVADFDQLHDAATYFQVTNVFCCLGTTIKKAKSKDAFRKVDFDYPLVAAKLAEKQQVERFIIISAMGANAQSSIFYNQVKGQMEEGLQQLNLTAVHILRPSLLLGEREEFRLGEKMASVISPVWNALCIGPLRQYRAIDARNVAKAMVRIGDSPLTGVHTYLSHEIEKTAIEKSNHKKTKK
ncbi:oxidoreductase [Paenibacillus selenitireducens]|uniref:Oxidoreductase n=1 Tax=Paenibacillus selenitireducens TaxID=1324314 RepID=A0A1T2X3U6_9BACL|nr:oxidoreductase [Paenibacillus selenitireducens]OPA74571.1 oxidoreductase [Paenibacillus selenitireducens]